MDQPSSSDTDETQRRRYVSIWKGETESERSPLEGRRKSIVHFVQGQERGASWRISSSFHNQYAGRSQESWVSFYRGRYTSITRIIVSWLFFKCCSTSGRGERELKYYPWFAPSCLSIGHLLLTYK